MNFLQSFSKHPHFKRMVVITFFALSALAWIGTQIYGHYYITTDDAYVNANVIQISPRITGKIVNLYVENNQFVKKDQPLFAIDPAPFQAAVDSAQAQVEISEAQLVKAENTAKRTMSLVKRKYLSPQEGDNATANLKTAIGELALAKANLTQAELNLQYTKVNAPASGWITNASLRVGDVVPENQPLFALVSNEVFWVDANFKETEMSSIKPGQAATIKTDLYPDHEFLGVVESISSGAGAAFSLLPPQNATGNWVKVTQRVPVRVRVLNPNPEKQLRVGVSADVTIHLQQYAKQST